jgi:hypothetical protein
MQGWDFQDDEVSLHHGKEGKQAHNAVYVTISSTNLDCPDTSPDLNRMKQMWGWEMPM